MCAKSDDSPNPNPKGCLLKKIYKESRVAMKCFEDSHYLINLCNCHNKFILEVLLNYEKTTSTLPKIESKTSRSFVCTLS